MNQKETIAAEQKTLEELKTKLEAAQRQFNLFYKDLDTAIKAIDDKRTILYKAEEMIEFNVALDFFNGDSKKAYDFVHCRSYAANNHPDIEPIEKALDEEFGTDAWVNAREIAWGMFKDAVKQALAPTRAKNEELFLKRQVLDTEDYHKAVRELQDLQSNVNWQSRYIEKLSDLSYFRQYAKEQKAREERKAKEEKQKAKAEAAKVRLQPLYEKFKAKALEQVKAAGY